MATILVAASPQPRALAKRMLAGHDLAFAGTVEEAAQSLGGQGFDLIFCTIMFDDSRMFDLLRLVKSTPEWARIPFVCARLRPQFLRDPVAWEAIDLAGRELGAATFLNIADYPIDPEQQMRRVIDRLLQSEKEG